MLQLKTLKLVRSTTLSLSASTHTAIPWSSAEVNTGPDSWWSSGSSTQIVMPWAGFYLMSFQCSWAGGWTTADRIRSGHLNHTTTLTSTNFITGIGQETTTSAAVSTLNTIQTTVLDIPTAGEIYLMTVFANNATSLENVSATGGSIPPATLSFVYLEG